MKATMRSAGIAFILATAGMAQAESARAQVHQDDVLGVSLSPPADARVVSDQYLLDEEHGFTLVSAAHGFDRDAQAGEPMMLRVVWLHQESPEMMEAAAQRFIDSFPGVAIQRREAMVAGRKALVLENAPGLVTTSYIYVAAEGKLFQLIYPRATLDARAQRLLRTLRFEPARKSLASRDLIPARDALHGPTSGLDRSESFLRAMSALTAPVPEKESSDFTAQAIAGCVDYPTSKYLQTPITSAANGNGYTQAGPSYYGEGLHTKCNTTGSQNDHYALDMAMRTGDAVLNPTNGGRVIWAGWASGGWASLGRTVIIDQYNGYRSLSAHLSSISVASGALVDANSVIGRAGGSGNGVDGYWGSHLHQGLYLNALVSNGGTYGGQSAMMIKVNYCRNGCANYYWGIANRQSLSY
jgi:murein DD-endopeptidase MepM/ murein hydrolase activator NlpD